MENLSLLNGDARFFWPENLSYFIRLPYSWDSSLNTGIGINDTNTLWITSYLNLTSTFSLFGLSWLQVLLIFWFIPTILISFLSAFFLFRKITGIKGIYQILAGVIFTLNTYFLLVLLGGQMGVAFAYAFIPLVFLSFLNVIEKPKLKQALLAGLFLSLQILFDPRISVLTIGAVVFFYVLRVSFVIKDLLYIYVIPAIIAALLHSFWILPILVYRPDVLPRGYESIIGADFLSFAMFENTLSLLHPNWPENIFGKTYFMRVEFIILPILAFTSLLFVKKERIDRRRLILFFAFIAILSSFIAKGSSEPFGQIYLWAFGKIPGFSLFRDSTKLYTLIVLSFSILIPYTIYKISNLLSKKRNSQILGIIFLAFWLFSIRELILLPSRFLPSKVPEDYVLLKDFIVSQNQFFRTLWIPDWQRYGYFSDKNPGIGRQEMLTGNSNKQIKTLKEKNIIYALKSFWSIKYVIVPFDTNAEFFLEDRKYSRKKYLEVTEKLREIKVLKEIDCCKNVKVFELPGESRGRFFTFEFEGKRRTDNLKYKMISPTKYVVDIKDVKEEDLLLFSERFDKNWIARVLKGEKEFESNEYSIHKTVSINAFYLPKDGSYKIEVYYKPQKFVNVGLIVSSLTLVMVLILLLRNIIYTSSKKRKKPVRAS